MKKIFVFVLLLNFSLSATTWAHPHDQHEAEQDRQIEQNRRDNEETRMRQDEERQSRRERNRESAVKTMFGVLSPGAGAVLSTYDSVNELVFGPKCGECSGYVDDDWDHRYQCDEGHYYWRCNAGERAFHKWCVKENTDCGICQGEGCRYCNSSY